MDRKSKSFIKKTRIHIKPVNDVVQLTIGNWGLDLPYNVALELAAQMRISAKAAKRFAGDSSRVMRVRGELVDANPYPKRGRSQVAGVGR